MLAIALFVLAWLGWGAIWFVATQRLKQSRERRREQSGRKTNPLSGGQRLPQLAGGVLVALSLLHILPDLQLWQAEGFAILMLVVALVGLVFAAWARLHEVDVQTQRLALEAPEDIVKSGPFAIVRHPVMAGLLLALVATVLAAGRFWAIPGAILVIRGMVIQARHDEEALVRRYRPGAYLLYSRSVPMLVPERLRPPEWLVARVLAVWNRLAGRFVALIGAERLARFNKLADRHVMQPARRLADRALTPKQGDDTP